MYIVYGVANQEQNCIFFRFVLSHRISMTPIYTVSYLYVNMCTITCIRYISIQYILSLFFDVQIFSTNLKDLLYSTDRVCYITK